MAQRLSTILLVLLLWRNAGCLAEVLLMDALHLTVLADCAVIAFDDDDLLSGDTLMISTLATARPKCLASRMQNASFSTCSQSQRFVA